MNRRKIFLKKLYKEAIKQVFEMVKYACHKIFSSKQIDIEYIF